MNNNQNGNQITYNNKTYHCPISMAMDLVGGKWKGVILHYLQISEKRFSELKKEIPMITEMTLSIQLKQLEKDGLIVRQVFGEKPPIKVVYTLSETGKQITPALESLCAWATNISDNHA